MTKKKRRKEMFSIRKIVKEEVMRRLRAMGYF